jgi:PPM family protein phosphatase
MALQSEWQALKPVAAARSDVGRVRTVNEDQVIVAHDMGLYAVADGVGGHNRGDVASALALAVIKNFFQTTHGRLPDEAVAANGTPSMGARRLGVAIRRANTLIGEMASVSEGFRTMGTTVVAALFSAETGRLHIAHVGDSRCYRLRRGTLSQLTRDHTLSNDMRALNLGVSEDRLANLPRHIVTRALGVHPTVRVDLRTEDVERGDVYLLCTDGVSQPVPEGPLVQALGRPDPDDACRELVRLANEAGGSDNASALVVRFGDRPAAPSLKRSLHSYRWEDSEPEIALDDMFVEVPVTIVDESTPEPSSRGGESLERRAGPPRVDGAKKKGA